MHNSITFLGTGTSQGVPAIGCRCDACVSPDPKDNRLRSSAFVTFEGVDFLIDVGPDFRQQSLRFGMHNIDKVLITHEHNDHIIGLDELRSYNFLLEKSIPIYTEQRVVNDLKTRFQYVFAGVPYPGVPQLELHIVEPGDRIPDTNVEVLRVHHGRLPILGFKFGQMVYLTDVNRIDSSVQDKIFGTDVLVISALHHREHHAHFNLKEALEMIDRLKVKHAYIIHVSHHMGLAEDVQKTLPKHVTLAYDGLKVSW